MKLVWENLNEFERGLDPKEAMGTGLTPKERIKFKQQVPILKRPSPLLGKVDNYTHYSRGYKLWKLLDYIQKGEEAGGRRYKDLVNFYYGTKNRTTFSSGLFNSINRYTQYSYPNGYSNKRVRPNNRYFLNVEGEKFLEKYRDAFTKKDKIS